MSYYYKYEFMIKIKTLLIKKRCNIKDGKISIALNI